MESPEGVENVRKRRHMLRHLDYAQWRAAKVRLARAPGTRSRWTLIPPHKGILLPPGHPVSLLHDCRDRGRCQGRMKARQKIGARQKSRTQTPRLASPRMTRPARPRAQNPARRHLKVPFFINWVNTWTVGPTLAGACTPPHPNSPGARFRQQNGKMKPYYTFSQPLSEPRAKLECHSRSTARGGTPTRGGGQNGSQHAPPRATGGVGQRLCHTVTNKNVPSNMAATA